MKNTGYVYYNIESNWQCGVVKPLMKLNSHLFRYVLNESQSRQNVPTAQGSSSSTVGGPGIPQPPPGMSFYAAKRVIGDSPWTPELLEQVFALMG